MIRKVPRGLKQRYSEVRLTFKRDTIEPLAEDDGFEVVTPFGTFRFAKRQFYSDFPSNLHSRRCLNCCGMPLKGWRELFETGGDCRSLRYWVQSD
jgi:hypothetical protein